MITYSVRLPGGMYRALDLLGIFEEEGVEEAVATAFHSALCLKRGRGAQYVVTGPRATVSGVLSVLSRLVQEVDSRVTRVSDIGVELGELRRFSKQPLLPYV